MLRAAIVALALLAGASASAGDANAAPNALLGAWRVTHGVVAPWTDEAPIDKGWIGSRAVFAVSSVQAKAPLGCNKAQYEATSNPPEGLFMGGLEEAGDAATAAANLGFKPGEVAGVSLSCSSGLWEFHLADADTMLFALDNVIWTMSRAYGARAASSAPEGVVEALLERHFNGDMGFEEAAAANKKPYLTRSLSGAINAYFKRDFPADEVPPIDGDPYTDSQDYPARFAVGKGAITGGRADVPVDVSDAYSKRRLVFRMARESGRWRLDDIGYDDGRSFKDMLAAPN